MTQKGSKKRKEAPGTDRLSNPKHTRGRPTQPKPQSNQEPVAHRTRSKSRLNHVNLQPTSLRLSPAKASERETSEPGYPLSKGSTNAIEGQQGRDISRASHQKGSSISMTTIEQTRRSGSAIGRIATAAELSTQRLRPSYMEYVSPYLLYRYIHLDFYTTFLLFP